jgi:putative membrane protein insertion efficiency factor
MTVAPATLSDEKNPPALLEDGLTTTGTATTGQVDRSGGSGRPARVLLALIRGYQLARSGRPTGCRYLPTCSAYAQGAIERFGVRRGGWLAAKRLARCHPWGSHGADPVPDGRASC